MATKKLLLGGSPCTYWSIGQHGDKRETISSGKGWELFLNYVIAKQIFQPDYFLYENNTSAAQAIKDEIEKQLGYQRVEINSSDVSPQNRARFYVSNLTPTEHHDKGMCVRDILDPDFVPAKTYTYYEKKEKPAPSKFGLIKLGSIGPTTSQGYRVYSCDGKGATICANGGGMGGATGLYEMPDGTIRKLSVREAMRMQTIPDWMELPVSDSQAYKQIGNGWTIDVIKLFLSQLPKENDYIVLSMYDGMSGGQITLKELNINVKEYIAVEIDKYCQTTIKHNFPDTTLFTDAFDIRNESSNLYKYITEVKL